MKQKWLIVTGVLAVAALATWLWRFDLALGHVRARFGRPGPAPMSLGWTILSDSAERPELEAFVRERLLAIAAPAIDGELGWGFDSVPLLNLTRPVYERQPERVDADVVAAALTIECLQRCSTSRGYAEAPAFTSAAWPAAVQTSDAFRAGLRSAAITLAKYVPTAGSSNRSESYAALVTVAAADVSNRDDELAGAVVAYVLAANPGSDDFGWLSAALRRLAGTADLGPIWARALSRAADIDISQAVWNTLADTFRTSPDLASADAADAVVRQCAHRSRPPAAVDEACVDLGLAWSPDWAPRLRTAAAASTPDGEGARALLAAHERERTRTWQSVVDGWRSAPPITVEPGTSPWQYARPFERRRVRETALLLAAGPAAFAEVAALYPTTSNPEVINDAAFVLSEGSPRLLSSTVMDRIEHFRVLAAPVAKRDIESDLANLTAGMAPEFAADLAAALEADLATMLPPDYSLEDRRVAAGLLALASEGRATTRIHPLILALSIPVPEFSERASGILRELLNASEFADALFGFLAVRERYLVSEVDVYRNALIAYDGVGPAIERNLARLLAEARGTPERVPWILKVIGIPALGAAGGPSARPLLERYAGDTGSYLQMPAEGAFARKRAERKRFDKLAADALNSISQRGA